MKQTLIAVVLVVLFSSVGFCQFTDKPKEVKNTPPADSNKIVVPTNSTQKQVYVNMPSKENVQIDLTDPEEKNDNNGKYRFPVKQYELNGTYESMKKSSEKFDGFFVSATIRQKGLNGADKSSKSKKSTFGFQIEAAKWKGELDDENGTSINIEEYGILGSYARVTNRPFWNSFVLNFGFVQSVERGNSGLYEWKQVDKMFKLSGWVDLTRNKGVYFSSTNLSWWYLHPLSTSKSALYNGEQADYTTYNKRGGGLKVQQSVLNFDLSEVAGKVAFNVGFELGYYHFSQDSQDRWSAALYGELHYKYCKLLQIVVGQKVKMSGMKSTGYDMFSVNVDLVQVMRATGIFDF